MSNFFSIPLRLFLIALITTILFYVSVYVLDLFSESNRNSPLKMEGYSDEAFRNLATHERKIYRKPNVKLQKIIAIFKE